MADTSRVLSYIMIIAVSAIMIAFGARELERRFVYEGPRTNKNMRALVEDLHGDRPEVRASMAGRYEASKGAAPVAPPQRDLIGKEDREELNQLLDKLAP